MRTVALLLTALALLAGVPSRSAPGDAGPEALLKNLPWRAIGPAIMGGRIDELAVVESRPATFYMATASGGLFKTTNGGTTWQALFDGQRTSSIGAVALAPSNPEVVWVGTGESNNRQSSSWGDGVYRSTDGGKSWSHLGLAETMHIARIVVDPRSADTAYVGATGRLWGPSPERGLYKTTDGGKSWSHVLPLDPDTGVTDVVMDPRNPDLLYAAAYQRRRTPWGFNGGGPGSALYKTTDGGATWKKLGSGLPTGELGRIGLSIYRKNPAIVYALVESASSGIYRSDDYGESWRRVSATNPRPMYFSQVRVDPNDDRRIWVLGVTLTRSDDGGSTFRTLPNARLHADQHALWIDPTDSNHVLVGCDGGVQWSYDAGQTWDFVNNLPLAQFYEVSYDMRQPYWVYGGLQDNGSWGAPSATLTVRGVSNDEWTQIGGGDGFYVQADPTDWRTLYVESQNGNVSRYNQETAERKNIRPRAPAGEPAYRFDWNTPILISPHSPMKILLGGNRLFISRDRGDTWRRTEDLTTSPDRRKLPIMGVLPGRNTLSLHDGQATFGHVVTVSESPVREGVLWTGTDDGNLHVSRDDGRTWKNMVVSVPGLPRGTYVTRVVASAHVLERCYATFDGHRGSDFRPYLYVTEDFGESWSALTAGIPEGDTVSVIREHPRKPDLLFAGTERGLWVSFDRGARWRRFGAPLPTVPVDDLQIHPRDNDLILATHGRGIWILDDLAAFERLAGRPPPEAPALFPPRLTVGFRAANHKANAGNRFYAAANPPAGAVLQYFLPHRLADGETVNLTVLDRTGKETIRELAGLSREAGAHRVVWDLRHAPITLATEAAPAGTGGGGARRGGEMPGRPLGERGATGLPGPRVLPGGYLVRLTAVPTDARMGGSAVETQPLRVEDDPRVRVTDRDRRAQHAALTRLGALLQSAGTARARLRALQTQATALRDATPAPPPAVRDAVTTFLQQVTALQARIAPVRQGPGGAGGSGGGPSAEENERPLDQPPPASPLTTEITRLYFALGSVTAAPSKETRAEAEVLEQRVRQAVREVNTLRERAVPELNARLEGRTPLQPGDPIPAPR